MWHNPFWKILPSYYNLFVGILSIFLGFFVLNKNITNKLCWIFWLMCLSSGLTSIFSGLLDIFAYHFNYIENFFILFYPTIGGFVPGLFLIFLILFPKQSDLIPKKVICIIFLCMAYFSYLGLTKHYHSNLVIVDRILQIERTPYYLLYIVYGLIVYLSHIAVIKIKIKNSIEPRHIQQLTIVLKGAFTGGFLILFGNIFII